jgi:cytochrome c553
MRKTFKVLLSILLILVVGIALLALYVKKALPRVGPPADMTIQITPGRVAHGKYLASHVAACIICHSSRDLSVYSSPVIPGQLGKGGERFGKEEGCPGNIYATNLTPYVLRQWTDGELFRAITTGESQDGHALFPIMNYPAYGQLDPEDIFSIIAYLRTLPSIPNTIPVTKLDFPVNFIVNTMPAPAALEKKPDSNNITAYGKYLVKMASCVECHSRADKGQVIVGTEFGGGRGFDIANRPTIFSANITPDKETGIGNWSRELFIRKFKQYADSGYRPVAVGAGDRNTPMPWTAYAGMDERDLSAIYAFLQTVKPIHDAVKP